MFRLPKDGRRSLPSKCPQEPSGQCPVGCASDVCSSWPNQNVSPRTVAMVARGARGAMVRKATAGGSTEINGPASGLWCNRDRLLQTQWNVLPQLSNPGRRALFQFAAVV